MRGTLWVASSSFVLAMLCGCPQNPIPPDPIEPVDAGLDADGTDAGAFDAGDFDAAGTDAAGVDAGTGPADPPVIAARISKIQYRERTVNVTITGGSFGSPSGTPQVEVVYGTSIHGLDCAHDDECGDVGVCVDGTCRTSHAVAQTDAVTWTSSAPSFVTISNADGTRGQLTGVAPGTSDISATYTDQFGTVTTATTRSTATTPAQPRIAVTVVPPMLCDLIVTTRPFDPSSVTTGTWTATGVPDANRPGSTSGIGEGDLPLNQVGLARRRVYFPHAAPAGPGATADDRAGNDSRVLLPNVAGLTQQFQAIGLFALNGLATECGTDPSTMFAVDVTRLATWDVTTAGNIDTPNVTGTTLTTDAALTIDATGLATSVASSTPDRIQAVRATINSGERSCTGNGTAVGTRNATNPCVHALAFEVCGSVDTSAGLNVTLWSPRSGNLGLGVPNLVTESTAPVAADSYSAFIGDDSLRAYALCQALAAAGGCALTGAAPSYQIDCSEGATWSSSNPSVATVQDGRGGLRAIASGTTSIEAAVTIGSETLTDGVWLNASIGLTAGETSGPTLGGRHSNINWVLVGSTATVLTDFDADWYPAPSIYSWFTTTTVMDGRLRELGQVTVQRHSGTSDVLVSGVPAQDVEVTVASGSLLTIFQGVGTPRFISVQSGLQSGPTTTRITDLVPAIPVGSMALAGARVEKPGYTTAVTTLGAARIAPLGVPATGMADLATSSGSTGYYVRVDPGQTVEICVTTTGMVSYDIESRFEPGFTFGSPSPGCTTAMNNDAVNFNWVLVNVSTAAPPPPTITVRTRAL